MITEFLPSFRAIIAKKLVEDHGFSQTEVADVLQTTQPAISQYLRQLRGKKISMFLNHPKISELIEKIAKSIAFGDIKPENTGLEFCKVCKLMRENNLVNGYSLC
ncbi:MAG: hypothetical protein QW051_02175 [Candidatus Aenigmatarchaeota archaeon]